jgi:hypothetical protein
MSMTRSGSVKIESDGKSRTCQVSLETVYDADDDVFTTTGTVCLRQVNSDARPRGGLGNQS